MGSDPNFGTNFGMIARLIVLWLINSLALLTVAYVVPGVEVQDFKAALIGAVVLALVNAVIRPLLILLTLPATLLTLGLFIFVINGLLFWFVGSHVEGFRVAGFWTGVFGAILYSIVSWALSAVVLPERRVHVIVERGDRR